MGEGGERILRWSSWAIEELRTGGGGGEGHLKRKSTHSCSSTSIAPGSRLRREIRASPREFPRTFRERSTRKFRENSIDIQKMIKKGIVGENHEEISQQFKYISTEIQRNFQRSFQRKFQGNFDGN